MAKQTRDWVVFDAKEKVLGRFAAQVARRLMGKHKVTYLPHVDAGDAVVVVNAGAVRVTGNKAEEKKYPWHTGYPRGYREVSFTKLLATKPEEVIRHAVAGMLPKNRLQRLRMRRLHVYAGESHPHTAQQPAVVGQKGV